MLLEYLQQNWVEWVFAIIAAIAAFGYRSLSQRLKKEKTRNDAVAEGMQALLRESIVDNYNKYYGKGYCPIYAKESVKKVYTAYKKLEGDDVATGLYQKLLAMPEAAEPPEKGTKNNEQQSV